MPFRTGADLNWGRTHAHPPELPPYDFIKKEKMVVPPYYFIPSKEETPLLICRIYDQSPIGPSGSSGAYFLWECPLSHKTTLLLNTFKSLTEKMAVTR
jgi:hypothetical protein